jgi:hypothetical protein
MTSEQLWALVRPRAWLQTGFGVFDLSALQIDYELNAIPRATMQLPMGRDLDSGAYMPIHRAAPQFADPVPLEVWAEFLIDDSASAQLLGELGVPANTPVRLFRGTSAGLGDNSSSNSAGLTLGANGWLAALTEGTTVNRTSHPSNPAFFTFGAITEDTGDSGLEPAATVACEADRFVTADTVSSDFWGQALLPWFLYLCRQRPLVELPGGTELAAPNAAAAAALARMGPGAPGYVPSPIDLGTTDLAEPAQKLADQVAALGHDPSWLAQTSFWDLLTGRFAGDFGLAVVPRVDTALVVPYLPNYAGSGGRPFRAVMARHCLGRSLSGLTRRPLRGYAILGTVDSDSGLDLSPDNGPDPSLGIGGFYDTGLVGGQILVQGSAPAWCSGLGNAEAYASDSFGGIDGVVGTSLHPGEGAPNQHRSRRRELLNLSASVLEKLARAKFGEEALRGRMGFVTGLLRLDLAPGSVVAVEGRSENLLGALDTTAPAFYGTVLRHSLVLDANNAQAASSLVLGSVRSVWENATGRYTMPRHPFYTQTYWGSTLLA